MIEWNWYAVTYQVINSKSEDAYQELHLYFLQRAVISDEVETVLTYYDYVNTNSEFDKKITKIGQAGGQKHR